MVDFLVIESPLIRVNFERLPNDYGSNLTFLRAVAPRQPSHELAATSLPSGQACRLELMKYHKIFVFGDDNIILFDRLAGHKVAWPDDPPHLVSDFKASCPLLPVRSRFRSRLRSIQERWKQHLLHRALRSYELIVHHAHHHADEFQKASARPILYAPPLIPTMSALTPLQSAPSLIPRQGFIHIGHLGGAASLASIETLLSAPLCEYLRTSKEPLVLIGKADIPITIKSSLEIAGYLLMGFVDDLESAISSCRAVVVPGDYAVGARTRILHSLSLGTPVVAHRSCIAGIPELQTCKAVELFDSAEQLVRALAKLEKMDEASLLRQSVVALEFMADFAPRVEQKWKSVFGLA
jgi:glycosyltransferase involved in cell wall biosynthesis